MLDSLTSDEACARASNPETPLEELVTLAEVCPCAALANPAWLVPESQEYLHSLSPLLLLRAVQAWEEVPAFWLPILVGIPYTPLRLALAQKPLPPETLLRLVQDPDPGVRAQAWARPEAQNEPVLGLIRLLQAMEKESQEVLPKALAFTPRGPYLEILLARHPATPERVLREIARSKNPFVLEGFCQREDLPPELVRPSGPSWRGSPSGQRPCFKGTSPQTSKPASTSLYPSGPPRKPSPPSRKRPFSPGWRARCTCASSWPNARGFPTPS